MRKLLLLLTMSSLLLVFAPKAHSQSNVEQQKEQVIQKEVVSSVASPTSFYRMSVRRCGYDDLYSASVGAGHAEWQLQQQGYGNFEVKIDCDTEMCWSMCYTVYYSLASIGEINTPVKVPEGELVTGEDGRIYKKI